jgi:hypothetical protein
VRAHDIENLKSAACGKRVSAQNSQVLIGDSIIESVFVFAEMFPIPLSQPSRIPRHSYANVSSGRCLREFCMPTGCHSLEFEGAALEIPVASRDYFYTGVCQVSTEARDGRFQGIGRFRGRQWLGNNPQAELLVPSREWLELKVA